MNSKIYGSRYDYNTSPYNLVIKSLPVIYLSQPVFIAFVYAFMRFFTKFSLSTVVIRSLWKISYISLLSRFRLAINLSTNVSTKLFKFFGFL